MYSVPTGAPDTGCNDPGVIVPFSIVMSFSSNPIIVSSNINDNVTLSLLAGPTFTLSAFKFCFISACVNAFSYILTEYTLIFAHAPNVPSCNGSAPTSITCRGIFGLLIPVNCL